MDAAANDAHRKSRDVESNETPNFARRKRIVLIVLAVAVCFGSIPITLVLLSNSQFAAVAYFALNILVGLGILAWCKIDGEERNEPLTSTHQIVLALLSGLALVHYLFTTRRFGDGLIDLGSALLYAIGLTALSFIVNFTLILLLVAYLGVP